MDQTNPPSSPHPPPPPHSNLETTLNRNFQELISQHPTFTIDQVFYCEATRLYLDLLRKKTEVQNTEREVQELRRKLGIEVVQRKHLSANPGSSSGNQNGSEKKKRMRRTAVEIARHYICTIDKCNKSYGSEGSLNQHIKIKHGNEYSKHLLMLDLHRPNGQ